MTRPREIGYTDELLADGSVHRSYEDGRQEWRRRGAGAVVHWRDDHDSTGTDEPLGRIIKRTLADGGVSYGRDIGYGRTVWQRGEVVMVNRTSFGGKVGAVLAGLGVIGLAALTAAQLPPANLTPEEEDELRQQQAARQAQGSGGDVEGSANTDSEVDSGTDHSDGDWDDGDWDGGGADGDWGDDDFG